MRAKNFLLAGAAGAGISAVLASSLLMAAYAQDKTQHQPAPKCNISPVKAIEIAQTKVKGRTLQANFEFDEGKWVYGVMIVHGTTIEEVEIDPLTGKIGDVETVTPEGEAKEVQSQLTTAVGGKSADNGAEKEKDEKDEKPEKK